MKKIALIATLALSLGACQKGTDTWFCRVYDNDIYIRSKYYGDSTALERTEEEMFFYSITDFRNSGLPGDPDSAKCERIPLNTGGGMIDAYNWHYEYD